MVCASWLVRILLGISVWSIAEHICANAELQMYLLSLTKDQLVDETIRINELLVATQCQCQCQSQCQCMGNQMQCQSQCQTQCQSQPKPMTDCYDWLHIGGAKKNGIYKITPPGIEPFDVFCDMETDGGGWTVFQRRIDAKLSFYDKLWNDYKVGFNNGLENNLWLGNDNIHTLSTKDSNVELRIELRGNRCPYPACSFNPNGYLWEKHTNFFIDNEANFYALHLSPQYVGNATTTSGRGISYSNGLSFSTVDSSHGAASWCSSTYQHGAWWLGSGCAASALNGKYVTETYVYYGFYWDTGPHYVNPIQSRMMLRRIV